MNTQLVDSLIQAIKALTPEETLLFQEKLAAIAIQSTPGVCGGYARIRNTRIPVWTLVSLHQQGADEVELLQNYPGLSPFDLENAWRYYARHRQEIDRIIASHQTDED
ncbi:MAG TPA: DUF433 domain-containing protein [Oscillatoriales cyanobacterium M59_W2019_021]|nr:MAG: DUF433 domain-containing protein [Cyanobacteria bacterium J055]HIK30686.1 DUF433 domain-containing protein [Oscillatoriales cyanobacterium M4454_W2019_049]HIK52536.1 DUF433 domain-containing protein [Oscillatoriales cyanobacterium M59_W2019_021]